MESNTLEHKCSIHKYYDESIFKSNTDFIPDFKWKKNVHSVWYDGKQEVTEEKNKLFKTP